MAGFLINNNNKPIVYAQSWNYWEKQWYQIDQIEHQYQIAQISFVNI